MMRRPGSTSATLIVAAAALGLLASASPARAADRDCTDFPNQRAAQKYFIAKGGPGRDPDHLDSDSDGTACETLPCPCKAGPGGGGGGGRGQRIRARIIHVVDGDTIRVRARGARRRYYDVRLIGIDTPEKYGGRECGSAGASRSMRHLAPAGVRVLLVTDPTQDLYDRYGRLLAYVIRRSNGRDLGRTQVAGGWAKVYVFDRPFKRVHRYRRSARRARGSGRGVWGRCSGDFHHPQ
jgi:endonuclease YncB( thermonuclease family)